MQALGIDFRIRPVVRETLLPFSRGEEFPFEGSPVANRVTPPAPHFMKSLRVIPDICTPSTQRNGQSPDHHDVAHGKDPYHDQDRSNNQAWNPSSCERRKEEDEGDDRSQEDLDP